MLESGELKPRRPRVFPMENYLEAMDLLMSRKAIGKFCFSLKEQPGAAGVAAKL